MTEKYQYNIIAGALLIFVGLILELVVEEVNHSITILIFTIGVIIIVVNVYTHMIW